VLRWQQEGSPEVTPQELVTKADSTLGFFGGGDIREIGCNINFIDVSYFLSITILSPPVQI
jgi:hypothetical protein